MQDKSESSFLILPQRTEDSQLLSGLPEKWKMLWLSWALEGCEGGGAAPRWTGAGRGAGAGAVGESPSISDPQDPPVEPKVGSGSWFLEEKSPSCVNLWEMEL